MGSLEPFISEGAEGVCILNCIAKKGNNKTVRSAPKVAAQAFVKAL